MGFKGAVGVITLNCVDKLLQNHLETREALENTKKVFIKRFLPLFCGFLTFFFEKSLKVLFLGNCRKTEKPKNRKMEEKKQP